MRLILVIFGLVLTCTACKRQALRLQTGDILFQNLDCGPLCDAIEAVTEGVDQRDFSHCGLVVQQADSLYVLEAIGSAVQLTPLQAFLARSGDTTLCRNTIASRIKSSHKQIVPRAVSLALAEVGQPYDDAFMPNNSRWYCSELLSYAFNTASGKDSLFVSAPMTFKNSNTGQFFQAWIEYYSDLGVAIPEGMPGNNPGSMSRSPYLEPLPITVFETVPHWRSSNQ
jgi:hypothetical protein